MKILGLCLLLFASVAPISPAQESPKSTRDWTMFRSSSATGEEMVLNWNSGLSPGPDNYCAYLRTYRVKRQYRGSDVVSPAGYTTCVPTKRFEMKSAVQVQSETAPRE